jgi:hypothetical protein
MKHELIKQVDNNTIVTVEYGIYDKCGNGYDHFEFDCDKWGINGDRKYSNHINHNGKNYYFLDDINSREEITEFFPELINVFLLAGKDVYGIDSYPLLNGKHYLQTDINYAAKYYGISLKEAKAISKYNDKALIEYILNLIDTVYKKQVLAAIKEVEATTGLKYKVIDLVSPTLYNDIHYTCVTDKGGWNVYKGNQSKIKAYPKIK